MDPASITTLVNTCVSLAYKLLKVSNDLYTGVQRFKKAETSLRALANQCSCAATSIFVLQQWIQSQAVGLAIHEMVLKQLSESLVITESMATDLSEMLADAAHDAKDEKTAFGFRRKAKVVWNHAIMGEYEHRLLGQAGCMTLLLSSMQMPSMPGQETFLKEHAPIFRKAAESACSIINSEVQSSMEDRQSICSVKTVELEHMRPFENILFTGPVYQRIFRSRNISIPIFRSSNSSQLSSAPPESFAAPGFSDRQAKTAPVDDSGSIDNATNDAKTIRGEDTDFKTGQSELPFFKDHYSPEYILPNDKVSVLWAYQPRATDEFELERGDMLHVVGLWDDGWATGIRFLVQAGEYDPEVDDSLNSMSGEIKAFPLVLVCKPKAFKKVVQADAEMDVNIKEESKRRGVLARKVTGGIRLWR